MEIKREDLLYQRDIFVNQESKDRYIVFHDDLGYMQSYVNSDQFEGCFDTDIFDAIRFTDLEAAQFIADEVNKIMEYGKCIVLTYQVTYDLIK